MSDDDAANTQDPREHVRSNVFLSAVLDCGTVSGPVRVRNISATGALLEARDLPREGTRIRLRRGELHVAGDVAWSKEGSCGIRFRHPVDIFQWIKKVEHAGQRRVDDVVARLRAGESLSDDSVFLAEPSALPELEQIAQELTQLSQDLASAPGLAAEMAEELIRLDTLAQRLRSWVAAAE